MRVRILMALSAVLLLSVGVATAQAQKPTNPSQQLCESKGGTYSTRNSSSFFAPFYKKQRVVWTCNSFSGGSTTTQSLVQSCSSDGGQATSTLDGPPGFATCWNKPFFS